MYIGTLCTPFGQMCRDRCVSCKRRNTVIDVHEILARSGVCHGIAGALLEHIYNTGTEVS